MLYCKSSGRRFLQHELVRVTCDSRDCRNMRLRESCATLVKFDEILPLYELSTAIIMPSFTISNKFHQVSLSFITCLTTNMDYHIQFVIK